jgi:hypothetical protein
MLISLGRARAFPFAVAAPESAPTAAAMAADMTATSRHQKCDHDNQENRNPVLAQPTHDELLSALSDIRVAFPASLPPRSSAQSGRCASRCGVIEPAAVFALWTLRMIPSYGIRRYE